MARLSLQFNHRLVAFVTELELTIDMNLHLNTSPHENSLACDDSVNLTAITYGSYELHPDPEVIVFNLKRRHTGVSSTVNSLVPLQASVRPLGYCGSTMSNGYTGMTVTQAIRLSRKAPHGRPFRIWHVRRDHEMFIGLIARDVLRLPIRLVFTSAAQHRHSGFPRWLIAKMDAVIATTVKAASFVPNTTAVVPHGIDVLRFAPPADRRLAWEQGGLKGDYGIGCFGRIRPDKGTDVFVRAMIEALPQLPGGHALIAGQARPEHAKYLGKLQLDIASAGLTDRFTFLGDVDAGEIPTWYQRCRLFVACPRYESFGLTPFEAAATGCALICSRTGAFSQLIDPGVTGLMIAPDNAAALSEAALSVLAGPERAARMGERARSLVVSQFSLQAEANGIARIYDALFDEA
jgi:mannosyltransferase